MLPVGKTALFVGLGLAFWFTGLLLIRFLGGSLLIPNSPQLLLAYAACFPILYLSLWIASAISRTPMHAMLTPTVIMTFSAVLVDGALLGWMPQVYHEDMGVALRGAAWLLWGGAAGLLIAWLLSLRAPAAQG